MENSPLAATGTHISKIWHVTAIKSTHTSAYKMVLYSILFHSSRHTIYRMQTDYLTSDISDVTLCRP